MLGRLLQTATAQFQGSASRPHHLPLESIQEEQHTRELLFPDLIALKAAQQFGSPITSTRPPPTPKEAGSYDHRGGLDSIAQDDIRIIIAQDTCARWQTPQILFDSNKEAHQSPKRENDPAKKQALSARGKAMTSPLQPTTNRRGHTAGTASLSRATAPMSPHSPTPRGLFAHPRSARQTTVDPFVDMESRDEKDETDALLNCMFGAAGFRLHSGTKLHIMPRKVSGTTSTMARPSSSSGTQRRRTPLSRSTSLADWEESSAIDSESRTSSTKPSIMITRLFSVSLYARGGGCQHQQPLMSMDQRRSEENEEADNKNVKQKKVPMYAVSIIIQLPDDAGFRSRHGHEGSFSSSSPRRPDGFLHLDESRATPVFDASLQSHSSYVLSHWTILNRNIEILEHTASHSLRHILQAVPSAPRSDAAVEGSTKIKKSKQSTQQLVFVMPDCLQDDKAVRSEVDNASKLVVSALRIRKVVVGQERWGAWREEARWVGRWATSKEQPSFFYHVLTAFLGNHNVWLRSLQSHYRRRTPSYRQAATNEQVNIRYRTVIISADKMAARRFIFLLSHFFPNSMGHTAIPLSTSFGQSYETPPSFSLGREKSLRRTLNNKQRSSFAGQPSHNRSVSFSVAENQYEQSQAIRSRRNSETQHEQNHEPITRGRRGSDTFSIRTAAMAIPSSQSGSISRKASISTVLAESDTPVPHFTALEASSQVLDSPRPSSGGSVASLALSQTLKRADSSISSNSARWSSMMSGFWSGRRGSSTSEQDLSSSVPISPVKGRTISGSPHRPSLLNQMVDEAAVVSSPTINSIFTVISTTMTPDSPRKRHLPRQIPEAKLSERMPLDISFNEDDGFLDISLSPGHSFQSSIASSFASVRFPTGSPHERYSMTSSFASDASRRETEFTVDAAGWLKNYHPNFTLQAVRPYEELRSEIEESMRAEASIASTPIEIDIAQDESWIDICVTLVANTVSFTIQRLRLQRRRRRESQSEYSYEERLKVETVTEIDTILTDAVERVLAVSSRPSRSVSRASSPKEVSIIRSRPASRPPSIRGFGSTSLSDGRLIAADAPHQETRRVVLGALQEVVRTVVEERDLSPSDRERHPGKRQDNALRDGVRKWLDGIDEI